MLPRVSQLFLLLLPYLTLLPPPASLHSVPSWVPTSHLSHRIVAAWLLGSLTLLDIELHGEPREPKAGIYSPAPITEPGTVGMTSV